MSPLKRLPHGGKTQRRQRAQSIENWKHKSRLTTKGTLGRHERPGNANWAPRATAELQEETAAPGTKSQERRTKETARRHVRKRVYAEGTQHMPSSSTPTRTHLPSTLNGGTQPQSTTQNKNSSTQEISQESPAEQPENQCKSRNQLTWLTNCSWKPAEGGETSGAFQDGPTRHNSSGMLGAQNSPLSWPTAANAKWIWKESNKLLALSWLNLAWTSSRYKAEETWYCLTHAFACASAASLPLAMARSKPIKPSSDRWALVQTNSAVTQPAKEVQKNSHLLVQHAWKQI